MDADALFMRIKTWIIELESGAIPPGQMLLISAALRDGGVIAYPTETFYGLGAMATSGRGIDKVFRLKRRDRGKPLSIVVSDMSMAQEISASVPSIARQLAEKFWPGPLTLVLKAHSGFPPAMLGPGRSVAVRVPGPAWLRALVRHLGVPLTATSANLSGRGEISDPEKIIRLFRGKVELVVDGGPTPGGLPSTIVDLTGNEPRLLRAGAIPEAALRRYFV